MTTTTLGVPFFVPAPWTTLRAGIDVGGTKARGVIVAEGGSVVVDVVVPTRAGPDGTVATIRDVLERLDTVSGQQIRRVGIGIPGVIDIASGVVRRAVNLGIDELDLGARLGSHGIDARIENDVNVAALGAFLLQTEPINSLALLGLGTGVAGAAVMNGVVHRGVDGVAGELGHIPVDPYGPRCGCGQSGCLKLYASGSARRRCPAIRGSAQAPHQTCVISGGRPSKHRQRTSLTCSVL